MPSEQEYALHEIPVGLLVFGEVLGVRYVFVFDHGEHPASVQRCTWHKVPTGGSQLFHGTPGYAADEAIEEKIVCDGNRYACDQRRRHEFTPVEDVAPDEVGGDAERYRLLVGRCNEGNCPGLMRVLRPVLSVAAN